MRANSSRGQLFDSPARRPVPKDTAAILVATADADVVRIVSDAVRFLRGTVAFVRSGCEARARARSESVKVLLLDQSLPDRTGLEVARSLRRDAVQLPFILVGNRPTTSVTVEAMQLGALTVLEKPVTLRNILNVIKPQLVDTLVGDAVSAARESPRSIAERWAVHVLKGCEARKDLRTLAAWASFVGLSYTSLCESCRIVGIQPLDARDLMRVLRAVIHCRRDDYSIEDLLDISDRRTLVALLERAGFVRSADCHVISVDQFLTSQRFVPSNNPGLGALRTFLRLESRWIPSRTSVRESPRQPPALARFEAPRLTERTPLR